MFKIIKTASSQCEKRYFMKYLFTAGKPLL